MRVCIVPEYPANLMPGGLQVQAFEAQEALTMLGGGISAELFNYSKQDRRPDLYHFVGLQPHLFTLAELLQHSRTPYVLTLLMGNAGNHKQVLLAAMRRWINTEILRHQRQRHRVIHGAGAIVGITEAEAEAVRRVYGLGRKLIHVVPHGIRDQFYRTSPAVWQKEFGDAEFVLCVGAIQRRKNQLLLLQACNQLKLPLVLLGPILPGETEYGRAVEAAVRKNEAFGGRWLQQLHNNDSLLASAYAACRLFVLLSTAETQPLSVMQAMAARKPVLLWRAPYTSDELFRILPAVPLLQLEPVAAALRQEWDAGQPTFLSDEYTWGKVARRLYSIYSDCMKC